MMENYTVGKPAIRGLEKTTMLKYFTHMGQQLAKEFERRHCDYQFFPQLARLVLQQQRLPPLDSGQILAALTSPELPRQRLDDQFSDLTVTLFKHQHFRIDLLCWLNASTSIHQHAFSGAFRVWQGSSMHSIYRFEETQRFNTMMRFGKVTQECCEYLKAGDVRVIEAGSSLTHAVFHLEAPTYTIIIRTHGEPWSSPQFNLLPPYLAYSPDHLRQEIEPVANWVRFMLAQQHPNISETLLSQIPNIKSEAVAVHGPWWFELLHQKGHGKALVEAVSQHHPKVIADNLVEAGRCWIRTQQGMMMREKITDEDTRYFIAALMNSQNRQALESMLAPIKPEKPDVDTLWHWLRLLLQSGELTVSLRGSAAAFVVKALLSTNNVEDFIQHLGQQHASLAQGDKKQQFVELYRRIRSIPILQPVFR